MSWLLTVVMITSIATGMFGNKAAYAQTAVAGASPNAQDVAVVRFINKSGALGDSLAMDVTNQVANELSALGKYVPLPERNLEEAIKARGLKPPFDQVALARLAAELNVATVVTGTIEYARVRTPKGGVKTAEVAVLVRVTEATSGDLLSGGAQIGVAKSRPGISDDDSLLREAANTAALLAVKQIAGSTLQVGTIVNTVGQIALVNRGSRDGVETGMRLIVLRDRQRVGTLQVQTVYPSDCEAKFVDNILGIRPEDKVRAVFPMPPLPKSAGEVTAKRPASHGSMSGVAKILGTLLVGIAVVAAVAGGRNKTISGVTAEAMIDNGSAAVRLTWRNNMWAGGILQQYHVWRAPDHNFNYTGVPVAAVDQMAGNLTYVDHPTPTSYWDGVRSFLQPALPGSGTDSSGTGAGTGELVTPGVDDTGTPLGFTIGDTITYSVNSVIRRQISSSTTSSSSSSNTYEYEDIWTDLVTSGNVTPILPATLRLPADGYATQDLSAFQPTWLGTAGASMYQIEVSTDGTFLNRQLIVKVGTVTLASADAGGAQMKLASAVSLWGNATLRKNATFKAYEDGTSTVKPTLYWRVGARNDSDKPGPIDWTTKLYNTGSREFRFIYTAQPFSFKPEAGPPNPPSS